MDMQTSLSAVIIAPVGTKVTERRENAVAIATSAAALSVAAARGGKIGKAAAARNVQAALVDLTMHCANSNYRPLAEYLAITTGKVVVIDRHTFHALPSMYRSEMMTLESMGKAVSAATGKPSAAYMLASDLHRMTSELVAASERIRAERDAERKAREVTSEIRRLMDAADEVDAAVDADAEAEATEA